MAEIRSTLDIVMEKTKGLRLTEEEKEKLWEEGLSQRANGLCIRYLDGHMDWDAVEDELLKLGPKELPILKKALLGHLVNSIEISRTNDRAIKAIDILTMGKAKEKLKKLSDLISSYLVTRQKREKKVRADLWAELAKRGISGSAVVPNVEVSPQWQEMENEIEREYSKRLMDLKEQLIGELKVS